MCLCIFADQNLIVRSPSGEIVMSKQIPGRLLLTDAEEMLSEELGGRLDWSRVEFEERRSGRSPGDPKEARAEEALNLSSQKSFWNYEVKDRSREVDDETFNGEYVKLFCLLYPPNIVSNRLERLERCGLLPGSRSQVCCAYISQFEGPVELIRRPFKVGKL